MYDEAASLTDPATLYGMRLCNAIKSQRCIYDPQSAGFRVKTINTAAWKVVAKQCNESVANCRFRWKTIRNAFSRSYKKYGDSSQYYLYAYLIFLIPYLEANNDKNDESIIINEDVNKSLVETEKTDMNGYSDSDTTKSAEESQKIMPVLQIQNVTNETENDHLHEVANGRPAEKHNDSHSQKKTDKRNVSFENNVIDILNDRQQETNDTKLEDRNESHCQKTTDKQNVHFQDNALVLETETTDSQPSLPDEHLGRRLRDRKTPKRFIDMDFSPETPAEKRPRRLLQRRKSVGGLVLKEFALRSSLPDLPYNSLNENFIRPKPVFTPEIPSYCDTTVDDRNLFKPTDNNNFKIYSDACALARPIMVDTFTITETRAETVSVGTQYEAGPRRLDDEFFDSLKPQMDIMNLRQKVHFKRRVYQALMEVLDDGTNFPKDNEIVQAAIAVSADFKASTTSELRLMRELVSIVQAAKTTPELGEIGLTIPQIVSTTESSNCSPIIISPISTPPIQPIQTAEKQVTPPRVAPTLSPSQNLQRQPHSTSPTVSTISNPLGIPRHVIQKAVKVAGTSGSTIMTHDGDKRRVYRIYPKNASTTGSSPAATQSPTPTASQPSTFFVTPPTPNNKPALAPANPINKPAPTPPNQSNPITSTFKVTTYTPPAANRFASNTTANAMLPPNSNRSPAFTNGVNKPNIMTPPQNTAVKKPNTMTPPLNNSVISQVHGKITQRRYSICGPAPTKTPPSSTQNKIIRPITRTAGQQQHLPPLQRIQQFPQPQEFRQHLGQQQFMRQQPRSTPAQSNVSQIQMSKPISLNNPPSNVDQPKPVKHIPAIYDNCRPRMVDAAPLPNPVAVVQPPIVQPETVAERQDPKEFLSASEASILEMAGTIAADNFGSFFNKAIKDEPED